MAYEFENLAKWAAMMEAKVKALESHLAEFEAVLAIDIERPRPDWRQSVDDEAASPFPSIYTDQRSPVDTACAAHWIGRKPQTLRQWACLENGPLHPFRVNGRLAWSVEEIRQVMCLSKSSPSK